MRRIASDIELDPDPALAGESRTTHCFDGFTARCEIVMTELQLSQVLRSCEADVGAAVREYLNSMCWSAFAFYGWCHLHGD